MSIHVRPYMDDDLPRLQAALAGWIGEAGGCGYYHVGNLPHWIYATLAGRYPLGEVVQVWQDGRGVAGIAINGLFGAAFHVFARPALRGGEAEEAMLRLAAETTGRLVAAGGGGAAVLTDVFGCDTARQALLERLGFARYRLWDHIAERALGAPAPPAALPPGFSIRTATEDDCGQLAEARNASFGGGWTPERYRDEVMRKPGYRPEREILAVAPDGRVAAFTVVWLDDVNRVGQFEPVGTVPAFQRRGLARALMAHALDEMRRQGMGTAAVEYDASNLPAAALYGSLGFSVRYETFGYRRG